MPKVFISYRQIDDAQRLRVRNFAARVKNCGIEVVLDQFYKDCHPGGPPEGWPKWSSDQAIYAEKVLVIGNAPWFRCFDGQEQPGTGLGSACEAGNLRQRLYDLAGKNDIIRVAYFDDADVAAISFDLKRYDRFHIDLDFHHLIAWLGGTVPATDTFSDEKPRALRFWSTRESIDRGELSVLAIIETLLAIVLLIALTVWFDTLKWMAVACALAPVMLLRTKESVNNGLQWWEHLRSAPKFPHVVHVFSTIAIVAISFMVARLIGSYWWIPLILLLSMSGLWSAIGLVAIYYSIRSSATILEAFRKPFQSFCSIPENWICIVLQTDSHTPPEFLPSHYVAPADLVRMTFASVRPRFQKMIKSLHARHPGWLATLVRWLWNTSRVGLYPFTTVYRASVKAACVIYLPLLWLARKAQYLPRTSVRAMLQDYLIDDIQRVRRWLATISVTTLMAKVFIWWNLAEARSWVYEHVPVWGLKVLHDWSLYLDPQHVPWWQITPALNGLLALSLMIYARRVLNLKDHISPDAVVLRNWRIANVLSAMLSIYTIICVVHITWKAGDLLGTLQKVSQMLDHRLVP